TAPERLLALVAELGPRFVAARDQTRQNLVQQGAAHIQKFGESIGMIESAFQEVEEALKAVERFARAPDPESGARARAWVVRAAWNQQLAMDAYQQAELRDGPTEMPLVNLLLRMKDGFLAGTTPREEFETAIRGAIRMAGEARDEIRAQEIVTPPMQAMIDSYQRLAGTLGDLEAAVGGGREALEKAVEGVQFASEAVRAAMMELNTRILTSGPTRLEHQNLVLNIAQAHYRNQVPDNILLDALEVFRKGIEQEQAQVERLLSLPTSSASLQEQAARTRVAYELHHEAVDLLQCYAEGDRERYEEARQALIDAAEKLADCRAAYQQIGEVEGKVLCVQCGAPNEPGARACSRCGARMMPQGVASSSTMTLQEGEGIASDELVMTENLLRLFESVNQVAEGRLSPEEFTEVLSWMEGLIQEHLLGLPPAPTFSRESAAEEEAEKLSQLEEELAAQREEMTEGAEDFLTSLNRMHCFVEDGDREHLISGVQLAREAAIRIQRAQRAIELLCAADSGPEAAEEPEGSPVV
ncbi:MAG: zinc-ribbon domain-containing protein, partial [Candidatus Eremiobacterota bacterium]